MKKIVVLSFLIVISINVFSQNIISPDNSAIRYEGRIDFTDNQKPRFSYSGVSIKTHFSGTSLSVLMSSAADYKNYYYVIIDDDMPFKISPLKSGNAIELAAALENANHTVEIIRLTESSNGADTFHGFIIDDGASVSLPDQKEQLKFEFVGNSITCGYGNQLLDRNLANPSDKQNFFESYSSILSRAFRARQIAVCRSGIGIYRNYGGPEEGSPDNMLAIYDRINHNEETPKWNFQNYIPDVVFINLGTNDFSTEPNSPELYTTSYRNFLDVIRTNYPSAKIVLVIGQMLNGTGLTKAKTAIEQLVTEKHTSGDLNVYTFIMTTQDGSLGYGGSWHPTIAQNYKNSGEILEFISEITDTVSSPIISKVEIGVNGKELILTVSNQMQINTDISGFVVTRNENNVLLNKSYVNEDDNSKIIIELDQVISEGDEIRLFYNNGNAIDANGHELITITWFNTQNIVKDTKILSLKINTEGTELAIRFNKKMADIDDIGSFKVNDIEKNEIEITGFIFSADKKTINLILKNTVVEEQLLYLSYSGDEILDENGIPLIVVDKEIVSNNSTVSIVGSYKPIKIEVYPNPLKKGQNLKVDLSEINTRKLKIEIIDVNGSILYVDHLNGKEIEYFSMPVNLNSGVYYLRLSANKKNKYFRKIIIE